MTTRLITTYQEAKALKEAGYPQEPQNNYADVYYVPAFDDDTPGEDICREGDCRDEPRRVRMVRLDELLAFLWDGGWSPTIEERYQPDDDEGQWMCTTNAPGDDAHIVTNDAGDQLAAVVRAVIYILNSERPAPTAPTT